MSRTRRSSDNFGNNHREPKPPKPRRERKLDDEATIDDEDAVDQEFRDNPPEDTTWTP